ncbi:hypothetical protein CsSME_00041200 [Camellia sinensis var. sinensis]
MRGQKYTTMSMNTSLNLMTYGMIRTKTMPIRYLIGIFNDVLLCFCAKVYIYEAFSLLCVCGHVFMFEYCFSCFKSQETRKPPQPRQLRSTEPFFLFLGDVEVSMI